MDVLKGRTTLLALSLAMTSALALGSAGCAKKDEVRIHAPAAPVANVAPAPHRSQGDAVNIAPDLRAACGIDDQESAPKFDFDSATLRTDGREQLDKLASCITSGPLRGHEVSLVGHADPRGDEDYNMALGADRARAVAAYLEDRGVTSAALDERSRGELDARGYDEETWAMDRRVDISAATASR